MRTLFAHSVGVTITAAFVTLSARADAQQKFGAVSRLLPTRAPASHEAFMQHLQSRAVEVMTVTRLRDCRRAEALPAAR